MDPHLEQNLGSGKQDMNKKYFVLIGAISILLLGLSASVLFPGKTYPSAVTNPEKLNLEVKEITVNGKKLNPKEMSEIPIRRAQELSISLVVQSLGEEQPMKGVIASLSQNLKIGHAIIQESNSKKVTTKGLESTILIQLEVPKDAELGTALLSFIGRGAKGKTATLANIPCLIADNK